MNRRDFLATSGTLVAASVTAGAITFADNPPTEPLTAGNIDAHSHIWTRDIAAYPLAKGKTLDDLAPPSFTTEELLAAAKAVGVSRVVLIQHRPFHGVDNSYITDTMAQHPGRFSAVACIDETSDDRTDEMDRLIGLGVRGFRIRPGEGGADDWRDSEAITALWKHAAKTNIAICPLINPSDLPMVDAMCQRHPDTTVVIDHFARVGVDGEIHSRHLDNLARLARHKKTHVKVSAFYALGKKRPPHDELQPMIRRLLEAFTPERLMWASDSPYQLVEPNTYADSLALITDRCDFLSTTDKEWLLRKTAERVFFASARTN